MNKKIIKNKSLSEIEILNTINKACRDPIFRVEITRESFLWFVLIYFADALTFPLAGFHYEIIRELNGNEPNVIINAFRGSGKSTICNLAYSIWSMVGVQQKKHIVIISNTREQAQTHLESIKEVLENNELLKNDLGPFEEASERWNVSSLIFKKYSAKIIDCSVGTSIRGVKFNSRRPDLIIADDIDTIDTVRNSANKQKIIEWFDRDIVPLGDINTRKIIIGTINVADSLIDVLRSRINDGKMLGIYHKFPIIYS